MSEFQYNQPVEIRYGDLDAQGHVNNACYLTYLEQARIGYMRHLGLWCSGSWTDLGVILAEARVTYRAPILFGQALQVGVRVSRLGGKSLTMEYCLVNPDNQQEMANAATILVTYDYKTGATIPIPDVWRKAIQEFEKLDV
jgi:acyl-CoA thioester hydrolase